MEREEHRKKLLALIDGIEFPHNKEFDLGHALYAFSELGLFCGGDIEFKLREDAIRIWAVVEAVRLNGFDKSLRM